MNVDESLVRAKAHALGPTLNVCFWPKADIGVCTANVRFGRKADMVCCSANVCL